MGSNGSIHSSLWPYEVNESGLIWMSTCYWVNSCLSSPWHPLLFSCSNQHYCLYLLYLLCIYLFPIRLLSNFPKGILKSNLIHYSQTKVDTFPKHGLSSDELTSSKCFQQLKSDPSSDLGATFMWRFNSWLWDWCLRLTQRVILWQ